MIDKIKKTLRLFARMMNRNLVEKCDVDKMKDIASKLGDTKYASYVSYCEDSKIVYFLAKIKLVEISKKTGRNEYSIFSTSKRLQNMENIMDVVNDLHRKAKDFPILMPLEWRDVAKMVQDYD